MNIGIIGAGTVGGTLGRAWARRGHQILYGVRDPSEGRVRELREKLGADAKVGTVAGAAAFGEVILLATPWSGTEQALRSAGNLSGKIVLDATNPLKADLSGLALGHSTSGGEQVAAWAAGAKVVKIFNTTGFGNMENPKYGETAATMFYCGGDEAAKAAGARLAADLGFEPVDAGPLAQARTLEPLALLWISLAYFQKQGPNIAFKLLRR